MDGMIEAGDEKPAGKLPLGKAALGKREADMLLDESLEESFPASDAAASQNFE